MSKKYNFLIMLAGIIVEIHSDSEGVYNHMKEYVIGVPSQSLIPAFEVDVSPEIFEHYYQTIKEDKGDNFSCSDEFVELIAIHTIVAENMLDHDVLLMHGSAICMDEEGYIFTAPSGTGKSTHSRLWRESFGNRAYMINDDKPMLICREDEIIVCGTPWNGKHKLGLNIQKRLKAIAFLERAEENSILPIRPASMFEYLYLQVYKPMDSNRASKMLELLSRICKNVKMYRLQCNMNPEAAIISYNGMN